MDKLFRILKPVVALFIGVAKWANSTAGRAYRTASAGRKSRPGYNAASPAAPATRRLPICPAPGP